MSSSGIMGRIIGLIVFLSGIGMLGMVFWLSWKIFEDPGLTGPDIPPGPETLLPRLTTLIVRLAFLLAMCVAASLIASKGIHLYVADDTGLPAPPKRKKRRQTEPEEQED